MKAARTSTSRRPHGLTWWAVGGVSVGAIATVMATQLGAQAAQPPVGLGTAASFAVLAGSTVTNTGSSVITGNLGVDPGLAVTGFPPGIVNGVIHEGDGVALQAKNDLTTAYNDAAGRTPVTVVAGDLVGKTLAPGVYKSTSSLGLTGLVTLDAHGVSSAVFVFQIASTLITGSASRVKLTGGAQACNVFWQVGSSATLGSDSTFQGNILALTSISLTTGATITGRALARNGAVTLEDNTINVPTCVTAPPTTPPTTTATPTTTGKPTAPATPSTSLAPTTTASPTATATGPGGHGSSPAPTPSPVRTAFPVTG
jgi:hypothetical protein